MANYDNQPARFGASVGGAVSAIDEGLRAHMLRVYNYMAVGLVLTGITAYATFSATFTEVGGQLALTPLGQAVQTALKSMIADGTYGSILKKWNLSDAAVTLP